MRKSVWAQHWAGQGDVGRIQLVPGSTLVGPHSGPRPPGTEVPSSRPCWPESCGCSGRPCRGWRTPGW